MSGNAEIIQVSSEDQFSLSLNRKPADVLAEAKQAATALISVIESKKNKVTFNGETYLENEDWILLGRFYGISPRVKSTTYVEFGPVHGWESTAEAYREATGQVIATADGMCLNDEDNWGLRPKYEYVDILDADGKKIWVDRTFNGVTKKMPKSEKKLVGNFPVPLFQLRSMAQTRATSKVLSILLKWVVVLAGFKPTPAEEVDQTTVDASFERQDGEPKQQVKRPERKAAPEAPKAEEKPRDPDCISEGQGKRLYAICKQLKLSDEEIKAEMKRLCKNKAGEPLEHSRDMTKADYERFIDTVDAEFKHHDRPKSKQDKDNF